LQYSLHIGGELNTFTEPVSVNLSVKVSVKQQCSAVRVTTSTGKPVNVREFDSCQGNVRDLTKCQ